MTLILKTKSRKDNFQLQLNQAYLVLQSELEQLKALNGKLTISMRKLAKKESNRQIRKALLNADTQVLKQTSDLIGLAIEERKGTLTKDRAEAMVLPPVAELFQKMARALAFDEWTIGFIRSMSLAYMVSVFENFLSRMLVSLLTTNPGSISEKQLKVGDMLESGTVSNAVVRVAEKEASDVLNRDIDEVREYFRGKFDLDLASFTDWKRTRERFYRRHVIVHNQGKIDQNYRLRTGYKGKTLQLAVTEEYLTDTISEFHSISGGSVKALLQA
jgi:hypothetical protein